ncbi:MAG: hypothetical protein EOP48_08010 [Sphingobacteriales bacterium]|nr:MAG: hypothetical protein EOP48_08010 [Sphingobacteriales bacterium]
MNWKSSNDYVAEAQVGGYSFYITEDEDGTFSLQIKNSSEDVDENTSCDSLEEAKQEAEDYYGENIEDDDEP